jgi:hypothetical protein
MTQSHAQKLAIRMPRENGLRFKLKGDSGLDSVFLSARNAAQPLFAAQPARFAVEVAQRADIILFQ